MAIVYYDNAVNFGDLLNAALWPALLGIELANHPAYSLLGVGTILNDLHINRLESHWKIVAGSGYGYLSLSPQQPDLRIHFVRGPHTCDRLGIPRSFGLGDPGYVAQEILAIPRQAQDAGTCFLPHFESAYLCRWDWVCKIAGIAYVNPARSFCEVSQDISQYSTCITESLHGAIVADSLRIPWIPVATRREINTFKWEDFFASIKVDTKLRSLSPPTGGRRVALRPWELLASVRELKNAALRNAVLSKEAVSHQIKSDLTSSLYALRESLHNHKFDSIPLLPELSAQ